MGLDCDGGGEAERGITKNCNQKGVLGSKLDDVAIRRSTACSVPGTFGWNDECEKALLSSDYLGDLSG